MKNSRRQKSLLEELRGCHRKNKYGSEKEVLKIIKRKEAEGIRLGYYECRTCAYFHLTRNTKIQGKNV